MAVWFALATRNNGLPMVSLLKSLTSDRKIAFILSPRLGDSLLSMVVVDNLLWQHIPIDVYGDYAYSLRRWFPQVKIFPIPPTAHCRQILAAYEVLLHAYRSDILGDAVTGHPGVMVLDEFPTYRQTILMPDIQVALCREQFGIAQPTRSNGLVAPPGLNFRQFRQRIVIHPMSHQPQKNWPAHKFVELAQQLQRQGYDPQLVVSPAERPGWEWVLNEGLSLPAFATLDALACWIYESGWMIGNDSGIGHLASNLGIPTLTIAMRARAMQRWRPSWAPGKVVLPPRWLAHRWLRNLFWKRLISVKQVLAVFKILLNIKFP